MTVSPDTQDQDRLEQQELESAAVSPTTARWLVLAFLAVISCVPLLQLGFELNGKWRSVAGAGRREGEAPAEPQRRGSAGASPSRRTPRPQPIPVVDFVRKTWDIYRSQAPWKSSPLALSEALASHFHDFEKRLSETSVCEKSVRPWVQLLACQLGNGNNKVVVGTDGWLFYRPDIDAVTGPGFLGEAHRAQRRRQMPGSTEAMAHPDPRPAILQFQRDCRAAGVHLVVVPIPNKAQLQPAQLNRRLAAASATPGHNPDWRRFVDELRREGVDVFDPTPEHVSPTEVRFLTCDTHWTPEFMGQVARDLAAHLGQIVKLDSVSERTRWRVEPREVVNGGDLLDLLHLPEGQRLFPRQKVTIRRVVDARTGSPWQSNPRADVVLLGDSYTNIFSEPAMKWGAAAGFGAQLSFELGRDLDAIALNGSGASETRAVLARRPNPLGGKKVVVWQFAVRDLAQASWKPIPMQQRQTGPEPASGLVVVVRLLTPVRPFQPDPNDTYPNALITLKFEVLAVEQGRLEKKHLLARMIYMQDHKLSPPARFKAGQTYRLRLEPATPAAYRTWRLIDDTDDFDLPLLWAAEAATP